MAALTALRKRGWDGCEARPDGRGAFRVPLSRTGEFSAAYVYHPDLQTAERMAVAAALVAEGHDLIGLLRDARRHIEFGWHHEDDTELYAVVARVDAVLAAVDGAA